LKCFNVVKIEIRFSQIELGFGNEVFGNSLVAAVLLSLLPIEGSASVPSGLFYKDCIA